MVVPNSLLPRKSPMRVRQFLILVWIFTLIFSFNFLVIFSITARIEVVEEPDISNSSATSETPVENSGHFWRWWGRILGQPWQLDHWDPVKDPHDFKYLYNPEYMCNNLIDDSTDILLVIFVNSAPKHVEKRDYIRKTFGNVNAWPSDGGVSVMRMVFLVGTVEDPKLQDQIHYESLLYNDIVQEDFKDDYFNLTRKTIMGMKWVTKFCRNAKYTMKVDDDILLNVRRVLEILTVAPEKNFSYGTVMWEKPIRFTIGYFRKFTTSRNVFAGSNYPPYLNGHAYIMSTDVVESVYNISKETDLFPWSDVFVGMCMEKLGLKLTHSQLFVSHSGIWVENSTALATKDNRIDMIREYVTVYHQDEHVMDQLWRIWTQR